MLFKGTTTRPGSRIDQEVQEAGGYMNAYTSFDRTVYHIDVPNTGATVAVDILCDIMQHATLPDEELAKELDVIRREMDMGQDDPARRAGRRLFETAYTRSPYRFTIIGYLDIFNELRPEDIRGYYRERYAPNNTFFVVVGDVRTDEVVAQIRQAYAGAKARPLAPVVLPTEPRQTAPREVIEEAPIELGHFHVAWHIPELRHPDVPALDVLAVLLGTGRSSRLYRQVREKLGLAHSADAWTYSPGNPGLFGMSALVDADKFAAARDAMLAEVERFKTAPVTGEELAKAVKQFVSATLASRKTMSGQASDLGGSWLAASDLSFSERYLAAVQRVTPADLQRVAQTYLTTENRTLYALLPQGAAPKRAASDVQTVEGPIQKFTLPNGLRLLVKESHRLPFVEFRAVFGGGVLAETPANNGITQLMGRLLLKGTARRDAEQIATEIESVGGHLDSYGGNNSFGVNAEVLASDFATGLDVLADVLLHPAFPPAALEREREVQLAQLADQRDNLLRSASLAMRRALFHGAGYGLDSLGTEESLARLGVDDLRAFHRQYATPDNCVLAIFGDVQTETVRAAVERAFAHWPAADAKPSPPPLPSATRTALTRVTETRDKKQAVLVLGFPGSTLAAPDRYALEVLQEACSDLGSRLFLRIREKLGLAYYVGAQNLAGLAPGYFAFYCGTAPEQAARVETELLEEAKLLATEGLSDDELRRAKAKLIGQRKIARQDLGGLASNVALDELYGLGCAHHESEPALIEAVTRADVQAAARRYLRTEAAVLAVLSPAT
jgi:zinc protease